MPALSPGDRAIVDGLLRLGAHVTTLDALGVPRSKEILAAGDDLTAKLAEVALPPDEFIASAETADIAARPELIRWGLEERLLNIVGA